jgi:hypothetical protein
VPVFTFRNISAMVSDGQREIERELRTTLEQYDAPVVLEALSVGNNFRHKKPALGVAAVGDKGLAWLTERHDRGSSVSN